MQLYGLTLVARRPVASARSTRPRRATCSSARRSSPGALATRAPFLAHNRALIAEVAELEHKARRQDVLVDDEVIAAFYAERVPGDVFRARVRALARATRSARPRDSSCPATR